VSQASVRRTVEWRAISDRKAITVLGDHLAADGDDLSDHPETHELGVGRCNRSRFIDV